MTLLTIVQGACDRIGLPRQSSVVSSADQTVRSLLALANEEGAALAREYPWQALTVETSFTTLAADQQTTLAVAAADFDRFVDDSMWDRTADWKIEGPISAQEWQQNKALVAAGTTYWFRVRGGAILFTPQPTAGNTVYFEYISKNFCKSSGGTGQSAWAADTDTGVLPEELTTMGIVWRFKMSKGLAYADDLQKYNVEVSNAIARDGGKPVLNMGAVASSVVINIPESSWSL